MNNNVFFDLNKKYNNIPNNSHVRCCQFILVVTLSLVFALIVPHCLVTLSSQFCCLAMQKNVSQCSKKCLPHWFLRDLQKITPKSLKSFVKRNLFQFILLYLHHKYYKNGSKEVESFKGRYGREGSVKYMVVGKVRSQSGDCL